jgi:hypothetical protein
MLPRQAGVTAFALTVLAAAAGLTSATSAGDVRTLPMQFELLQEGPTSACGDKCRSFIAAVGAITKDTPSDFATFTRGRDVTGAVRSSEPFPSAAASAGSESIRPSASSPGCQPALMLRG